MKKNIYLITLLFFSATKISFAQEYSVKGKLLDSKDSSALTGANIILYNAQDTTIWKDAISDTSGRFNITNVGSGVYKMKIMFVGYNTIYKEVKVYDRPVFVGRIKMEADQRLLKEVKIEGVQVRQEQKGDTTIYNADAFKVNKDATTEDLVKKMPGVTIENGTLKHQGEDVKKVLIDGKEFFGDDVNMAIKNLPAEMVDRVQVFDRASDQGFFSGFDDGQSQKTMNIMTKNNKNNGTFGKVYGGLGTDERYQASANANYFKGVRKVSLVSMSNNINQQNFGMQDLLGMTGSQGGGQRGGGMMGGMMGGGGMTGGYRPPGGGGGGAGGAMNFVTSPQGGISTTHSAGLNFTDVWGRKTQITASYFFNYADNNANSTTQRTYFSKGTNGQLYNENKIVGSVNQNHRLNSRIVYMLDSMNMFILSNRFSYQDNNADNNTLGRNTLADSLLNSTNSVYNSKNKGISSNNSILYNKRLKKYGRTFSAQLGADINDKLGNTLNNSRNAYYFPNDSVAVINQTANSGNGGINYSASLSYTEPIGKYWTAQATYNPSYNPSNANKKTYDFDTTTESHSSLNSLLSNVYDNYIHTEKGGINLRIKKEKWVVAVGGNYQYVNLKGTQTFPYSAAVDKKFLNVLPTVVMQFKFTPTSNLRLRYITSTNTPSVTQLQNVVDNSNTLLLSTGNPDLKQTYSNMVMARYNISNPKNSHSFFAFAMLNFTQDYIGNSTFIARNDMVLSNGIRLAKGSQLSMPVNINGNWSIRSFMTYSTPVKKLRSTINFNLGANYSELPGLINTIRNVAATTGFNSGIVIASNISDKLDFTITYTGNFNLVKNTLQTSGNSNYLNHLTTAKLNWNIWKNYFIGSDFTYTYYQGLNSTFNQKYILWNNSVAWKFLKDRKGELKFSVYDVLKQNNSVSRNVTETYIEDTQTKVLQRYYMLTFTYTFRNFKGGAQQGGGQPGGGNSNWGDKKKEEEKK